MEAKLETTFDFGGNFLKHLKETLHELVVANKNMSSCIESLKLDVKKVTRN